MSLNQSIILSKLDVSNSGALQLSCSLVYEELVQLLADYADSAPVDPVESTHQIRKKLKFFRAFCKLLKYMKSRDDRDEVNILLRDFGRRFSDLRDAHVRLLMLRELKILPFFGPYQNTLRLLEIENQTQIDRIEKGLIAEENSLSNFRHLILNNNILDKYFALNSPDPAYIMHAFTESYQTCFDAYLMGIESSEPHLYHEWRKRLKDFQYQYELILDSLPDDFQGHYLSVQNLGNKLGECNNLDMIVQWISGLQQELNADQESTSSILSYLKSQNKNLFGSAVEEGELLYQFSPDQLKERLSLVV